MVIYSNQPYLYLLYLGEKKYKHCKCWRMYDWVCHVDVCTVVAIYFKHILMMQCHIFITLADTQNPPRYFYHMLD